MSEKEKFDENKEIQRILLYYGIDIPIEILLGHNAPNKLKNTQHMLEKTKQQNS